jgi:drug/metabolite transporter (DMT)-like permease
LPLPGEAWPEGAATHLTDRQPERIPEPGQNRHDVTVTMPAKTMILVLGAVVCSATGQLLLKSGAQHLAGLGRFEFLLAAARDVRILSGLAAWIGWTMCWLYVLRVAPLSRAYALTSLTYVLIPLAGAYVFGEELRRPHVAGIVLIAIGIACIVAGD